ncbi:MAG TPA: isoprenyl transferase [Syntrophales bacterium]|nr:isoprenyl transferase [Syntrophales bacterium]
MKGVLITYVPCVTAQSMEEIDPNRLPRHIAIIMDGNGRWARRHTLGRLAGHRKGAEAVRVIVEACREIGIPCLTLYAFSSENWYRPPQEVAGLMGILRDYISSELKRMLENDIRFNVIGDLEALGEPIVGILRDAMAKTAANRGMVLSLALSYGGRDEIVRAARSIAEDVARGVLTKEAVDSETFARYLYTADLPDPDLLIRTSGEYRISNFLLWQCAYTEFYFTDTLWPDFTKEELLAAIRDFQRRERRFGRVSGQAEG